MRIAGGVLWTLLTCSWLYWALVVVAAIRWSRRKYPPQPRGEPVSIVKPLCGMDPGLAENLATFCRQHYPNYEVLFVAEEPEDPGLQVARDVASRHEDCSVRVLSGSTCTGLNRKIRNLITAESAARHSVIALSDSDMRVTSDYLARVTAPLSDPSVGVVTCLYRAWKPEGVASRLEALAIGAEFIPSVLAAWLLLGADFGFGSTIVIRREALVAIGGFAAIADELADDYRLCEKVRQSGWREVLSDYVVDYVPGRQSLKDVCLRRLRWARTVRLLHPAGMLGSVVVHGFALSLLLMAMRPSATTAATALATFFYRMGCAWYVGRHCTGDQNLPGLAWLLPLHDVWSFAIWLLSFWPTKVTWRGRSLSVDTRGRILT